MDEERRPGWYPDPEGTGRFRYRGPARWHGVTSAEPVWGAVGGASEPSSAPRRSIPRAAVIAVAALAVIALVVAGAALTRGSGGDPDDGPSTGSNDRGSTSEAASGDVDGGTGSPSGEERADGSPAGGDQPADSGSGSSGREPDAAGPATEVLPESATRDDGGDPAPPDGATPPSDGPADPSAPAPIVVPPPDPGAACEITSEQFAALLSTPEVRIVIGDANFASLRCVPGWAATESADGLIAVAQFTIFGWILAALGDDAPCNELEIGPEITNALAC